MNCTEAREAMLVAELAELRGETETPLATHVAGCADCRRASATDRRRHDAARARDRSSRRRVHVARVSRRAIGLVLVPVAAAAVFACR